MAPKIAIQRLSSAVKAEILNPLMMFTYYQHEPHPGKELNHLENMDQQTVPWHQDFPFL